ncbi:MAG: hypothetical protein HY717_03670 [Planctomycetes bacterium]|nr:hypothetical protein [Planctomycetota bacterium]
MISNSISSFLNAFSSIPSLSQTEAKIPDPASSVPKEAWQRVQEQRDSVYLSQEARRAARLSSSDPRAPGDPRQGPAEPEGEPASASPSQERDPERTPEEEQIIRELASRDREVRAHEAAHRAAGGAATRGGPSYSYQVGPDGKRYAASGEVPVQVTSSSADPRQRIQHAQQVFRAALAPADPSAADLAMAASARQEIAEAQRAWSEAVAAEAPGGEGSEPTARSNGQPVTGQPVTGQPAPYPNSTPPAPAGQRVNLLA